MKRTFAYTCTFVFFISACGGSSPTSPTLGDFWITGPDVALTGASVAYIAWARLSDGAIVRGVPATWSTDNAAVASINASGLLAAQGQGTVTIIATWQGRSATATVRVSVDTASQTYLNALLTIIEANSIHRATIDWARFRAQVFGAAGDARTIPDTFPAIRVALELLPDHESFYLGRGNVVIRGPEQACSASPATMPQLPDTVGYVKIAPCPCEGSAAAQFAESLQRAIKTADRPGLAGWIIDLRGNDGGNMWPMIAGVGPVLGEGIIGWIVYNNREYEREYRAGAALSLGEVFARVGAPYVLLKKEPKVAVLTDGSVASAAEAITVYFKGRPGTRSFGTPTCGHHHLQSGFDLSDGALLQLTTAEHADRMKTQYRGPIAPDQIVEDPEQAANHAIAWLQGGN